MPSKSYTAVCRSRRTLARDIVELVLEKPAEFTFRPGQFILFDVPLEGNPEDIQPRAFSIASAPHEKNLLFVFKLKEGGRASAWVQRLAQGDVVSFKGPFGFFTLKDGTEPVALLCTSTGIAPYRSMLEAAAAAGSTRIIDVVFGIRSEEDLFWLEDLRTLTARVAGVTLYVSLTKPSPAWQGHRGRLQQVVPMVISDLGKRVVYICGNPAMTGDVKQLCLEQWGVNKEHLHVEGYI